MVTTAVAFLVTIVAFVVGWGIYGAIVPKDVTYADVLTQRNASTFAQHNADWNKDDSDNVAYVQKAIAALGDKAYGMKFGALMDWEKSHEAQQRIALAQQGRAPAEYSDALTPQNVETFAKNNANWNSDDSKNVEYVRRAIARLGSKAYGRTFGDLMDNEKAFEKPPNDAVILVQGMTATLTSAIRCFDSKGALDAVNSDLSMHDHAGAVENVAEHSGTLSAGSAITVIDSHVMGDIEIRAQSGAQAGASCWSTSQYLKPRLSDIANP